MDTYHQLRYPDFFPQSCPPEDAELKKIEVYRFCEAETISEKDFKSFYEMNPERFKNKIMAYGLSVYLNITDLESARNKSPRLRKMKSYAVGLTYICTGKIKHTFSKNNPGHYTWWLFDGIKPQNYFKSVNFS